MDIVAPAVAGFFAVTSAVLGWRLKRVSDEKDRKASIKKERLDELKNLYMDVVANFDGAFKQVAAQSEFTLSDGFSTTGARLHLLAPHSIIELYDEACSLFDSWSILHSKATPPRREVNA
ncbi:hypothetical protein [Geotalea sp. SG265]|uniref:hypothetical protein n=1 Tax=Geotalea sp. SG265 TaxID=2922867 RepID=UPI001FAF45AE|nr:hypothetical protein [Geotalea sp. SG265]